MQNFIIQIGSHCTADYSVRAPNADAAVKQAISSFVRDGKFFHIETADAKVAHLDSETPINILPAPTGGQAAVTNGDRQHARPELSHAKWVEAVNAGSTFLGYWDWAAAGQGEIEGSEKRKVGLNHICLMIPKRPVENDEQITEGAKKLADDLMHKVFNKG